MNTIFEILLIIVILIALFVVIKFNTFTKLKKRIKQSKSSIDVYLNQRFDLIPNLVECVKAYMNYEEKVFTNIAKLRSEYNIDNNLKKGAELNSECNKLLAVGESNPDLKANEQFSNLQKSLVKMESQLQAARRVYNGDVTLYNTTISTFPNNILAKMFNFQQEELFEIEEYKKENVKLDI
jgi:LemA protein